MAGHWERAIPNPGVRRIGFVRPVPMRNMFHKGYRCPGKDVRFYSGKCDLPMATILMPGKINPCKQGQRIEPGAPGLDKILTNFFRSGRSVAPCKGRNILIERESNGRCTCHSRKNRPIA